MVAFGARFSLTVNILDQRDNLMGSPGSALHSQREVELHGNIFGHLKVGEVSHTTSTSVNADSYFNKTRCIYGF
jgi:hypothetical protein